MVLNLNDSASQILNVDEMHDALLYRLTYLPGVVQWV